MLNTVEFELYFDIVTHDKSGGLQVYQYSYASSFQHVMVNPVDRYLYVCGMGKEPSDCAGEM